MSRAVLLALLVLGCSDLTEGPGGVVALEIRTPTPLTIEVGEMLDLSARPLNKDGDSIAAEVLWVAPDPTLAVEPATGVITGVAPGTGRVQALSGSSKKHATRSAEACFLQPSPPAGDSRRRANDGS